MLMTYQFAWWNQICFIIRRWCVCTGWANNKSQKNLMYETGVAAQSLFAANVYSIISMDMKNRLNTQIKHHGILFYEIDIYAHCHYYKSCNIRSRCCCCIVFFFFDILASPHLVPLLVFTLTYANYLSKCSFKSDNSIRFIFGFDIITSNLSQCKWRDVISMSIIHVAQFRRLQIVSGTCKDNFKCMRSLFFIRRNQCLFIS